MDSIYLINSDLPVISLRLANICAPRLAIGPIPTFYERLKKGLNCFCSETVRDFLDISDFLDLMDLVLSEKSLQGVFNVSTGIGHSILEVYHEVCQYLSVDADQDIKVIAPGEDDVAEVVLDGYRFHQLIL